MPLDFTASVERGDSLGRIFDRYGYSQRDLRLLLDSVPEGKSLAKLSPGEEFDFVVDSSGKLQHLAYRPNLLERIEFRRFGDEFTPAQISRDPTPEEHYGYQLIEQGGSLFGAFNALGLPDSFATKFANIFRWDIDFHKDVRPGDKVHVVYNREYVDGEFYGTGEILAAEFVNRGKSFRAVRYEADDGTVKYYKPDGSSMQKAFLRAPLEYKRISSGFNPNRLHPVWKREMPHRGIDYAAPTGTPVKAVGDGKVTRHGHTAPNGNYVVIEHPGQIVTKYLHLNGFAKGLKVGDQVEQGDVIGYVGSTGWSTGPHLHYEFLVRGKHMNPANVELPRAEPIDESERVRFHEKTGPLLTRFEDYRATAHLDDLVSAAP